MQPKAYVPGVAVLLTALLAGCTGSDESGSSDDNRPGTTTTAAPAAPPGRYRTLPEPCGAVSHGALDALLPGIKQLRDAEQRETAYEGEATQTFDTDRRVGCRWKVESTVATDHLFVDFERVVSYDSAVSDADKAAEIYAAKLAAADLPEPSAAESDSGESGDSKKDSKKPDGEDEAGASGDPKPSESATEPASGSSSSPDSPGSSDSADSSPSASGTPAELQPRTLDDLSDGGFLNDVLSTAQQRTVTVVFRTSNVIVTIEYAEQPTSAAEVPDSKEMQDRARNLAARLAESFDE
ncbi:DUF3558 domain-containing protein [Streptomyces bluensis]|uniref:DUF3558 domain-containing protein n=1 Tax=Streptomyces bluensis TaxID=33897 RepID=UPI001671EFCB|nr:DUF3558 domain-containing protein [Streptomyces bluensis]GGZ72663.1 hypothetical protein GCM10010344_44680 [Streptomyces bluensis]